MSCYDINEDSVTIKNRSVDSASAAVLEKVQKYEHFVNDVLKSDLRHVLEERDKVSTRRVSERGWIQHTPVGLVLGARCADQWPYQMINLIVMIFTLLFMLSFLN